MFECHTFTSSVLKQLKNDHEAIKLMHVAELSKMTHSYDSSKY